MARSKALAVTNDIPNRLRYLQTITALLILALAALVPVLAQAIEPAQEKRIVYLLDTIEHSDLVFIRNGSEHSPEEARKHLEKKWRNPNVYKHLQTPEQFIQYIATESSKSKKPYLVKLPDGKTVESKDWLAEQLKNYKE